MVPLEFRVKVKYSNNRGVDVTLRQFLHGSDIQQLILEKLGLRNLDDIVVYVERFNDEGGSSIERLTGGLLGQLATAQAMGFCEGTTLHLVIHSPATLTLFFKCPGGETDALHTPPDQAVSQLKTVYEQITGIAACAQRLIWSAKQLDDHRTIDYYGINNESTVYVVLMLRGS